jgi:hypothetical protein
MIKRGGEKSMGHDTGGNHPAKNRIEKTGNKNYSKGD